MKLNLQLGAALILMSSVLSSCWSVNSEKDFEELHDKAKELAEEQAGGGGGGGGGTGVCSGGYISPVNDPQLNSYCGAAYDFRCNRGLALSDPMVQGVCQYYNDLREPNVPDCSYCK